MSAAAGVAAIERAALWAWPPREAHDRDGWLLLAGAAGVRRVNSVQTLAYSGPVPPEAAVATVERWYAARGTPACFKLTPETAPADLDLFLAHRGYERRTPVLVMTRPGDLPEPGRVHDFQLLHRPSQAVLNALADAGQGDGARRERAALFGRIRRPHRFGLVSVGGEPAAAGLVVVEGGLAGLFALRTQPPFRRQGLGRLLVQGLAAWARAQGAGTLYLQVEEANGPALALYAGLGFAAAYPYWYREVAEA